MAVWRIESPKQKEDGLRVVGDPTSSTFVRAAYRGGHLTHREYRGRVALHGAVRRQAERR